MENIDLEVSSRRRYLRFFGGGVFTTSLLAVLPVPEWSLTRRRDDGRLQPE